ncbi:MAG TPA: DotU family type IV/VI secretion system protein [Longimicrobium sp.]|jgi:type VI secretion system protein ImpK
METARRDRVYIPGPGTLTGLPEDEHPDPFQPEDGERDDPFLVIAFRQFYADVLRRKHEVEANPGPGAAGPAQDAALRATRVRDLLLGKLRRQEAEAGRRGGDWGAESYRDAQYAMATLADEVFLGINWDGRQAWADHLLEAALFGTYVGGERLFTMIDELLARTDPLRRPLGAVYLMVLSLRFQGRFRDRVDAGERIESYRRRLFAFVYPDARSALRSDRPVFANAYRHTARDAAPDRLPPTRRWLTALAAAVMLYLAISHGFWRTAAGGVETSRAAVEKLNHRADAGGR